MNEKTESKEMKISEIREIKIVEENKEIFILAAWSHYE